MTTLPDASRVEVSYENSMEVSDAGPAETSSDQRAPLYRDRFLTSDEYESSTRETTAAELARLRASPEFQRWQRKRMVSSLARAAPFVLAAVALIATLTFIGPRLGAGPRNHLQGNLGPVELREAPPPPAYHLADDSQPGHVRVPPVDSLGGLDLVAPQDGPAQLLETLPSVLEAALGSDSSLAAVLDADGPHPADDDAPAGAEHGGESATPGLDEAQPESSDSDAGAPPPSSGDPSPGDDEDDASPDGNFADACDANSCGAADAVAGGGAEPSGALEAQLADDATFVSPDGAGVAERLGDELSHSVVGDAADALRKRFDSMEALLLNVWHTRVVRVDPQAPNLLTRFHDFADTLPARFPRAHAAAASAIAALQQALRPWLAAIDHPALQEQLQRSKRAASAAMALTLAKLKTGVEASRAAAERTQAWLRAAPATARRALEDAAEATARGDVAALLPPLLAAAVLLFAAGCIAFAARLWLQLRRGAAGRRNGNPAGDDGPERHEDKPEDDGGDEGGRAGTDDGPGTASGGDSGESADTGHDPPTARDSHLSSHALDAPAPGADTFSRGDDAAAAVPGAADRAVAGGPRNGTRSAVTRIPKLLLPTAGGSPPGLEKGEAAQLAAGAAPAGVAARVGLPQEVAMRGIKELRERVDVMQADLNSKQAALLKLADALRQRNEALSAKDRLCKQLAQERDAAVGAHHAALGGGGAAADSPADERRREEWAALLERLRAAAAERDATRAEVESLRERLVATDSELADARSVIVKASQLRHEEDEGVRALLGELEAVRARQAELEALLASERGASAARQRVIEELTADLQALRQQLAAEAADWGARASEAPVAEIEVLRADLASAKAWQESLAEDVRGLWAMVNDAAATAPPPGGEGARSISACIAASQTLLHSLRAQMRLAAESLTELARGNLYEGDVGLRDLQPALKRPLLQLHARFEALEALEEELEALKRERGGQVAAVDDLTRQISLSQDMVEEMKAQHAAALAAQEGGKAALERELSEERQGAAAAAALAIAAARDVQRLQASLDAAAGSQASLAAALDEKERALQGAHAALAASEAALLEATAAGNALAEGLEAKGRVHEELVRSRDALEERVRSLEDKNAAAAGPLVAQIAAAVDQLHALRQSCEEAKMREEQAVEELQAAMDARARLTSELAALRQGLAQCQAALDMERDEHEAVVAALGAETARVATLSARCRALLRERTQFKSELAEAAAALRASALAASHQGLSAGEWCRKYHTLLRSLTPWRPVSCALAVDEGGRAVKLQLSVKESGHGEELEAVVPLSRVREWAAGVQASEELQRQAVASADAVIASLRGGRDPLWDHGLPGDGGDLVDREKALPQFGESPTDLNGGRGLNSLFDGDASAAQAPPDTADDALLSKSARFMSMLEAVQNHEFYRDVPIHEQRAMSPLPFDSSTMTEIEGDPRSSSLDVVLPAPRLEQSATAPQSALDGTLLDGSRREDVMAALSTSAALASGGGADIFDEQSIKAAAEARFEQLHEEYAESHLLASEVAKVVDNVHAALDDAALPGGTDAAIEVDSDESDSDSDSDSAGGEVIGQTEAQLLSLLRSNHEHLSMCEANLVALWAQLSLLEVQQRMLQARQQERQRDCDAAQARLASTRGMHASLAAREAELRAEIEDVDHPPGAPATPALQVAVQRHGAVCTEIRRAEAIGEEQLAQTQDLLSEVMQMDDVLVEWQQQLDTFHEHLALAASQAAGYVSIICEVLVTLTVRLGSRGVDIQPCIDAATDKLAAGAPATQSAPPPFTHAYDNRAFAHGGQSHSPTSPAAAPPPPDAPALPADATPITRLAQLGAIWPGHSPGSAPRRPDPPAPPALPAGPSSARSALQGILDLSAARLSEPHGLLDGIAPPPAADLLAAQRRRVSTDCAAPPLVPYRPDDGVADYPPRRPSVDCAGLLAEPLDGWDFDQLPRPLEWSPSQGHFAFSSATPSPLQAPSGRPSTQPDADASTPRAPPDAAAAAAERFYTPMTKAPSDGPSTPPRSRAAETLLGLLDQKGFGLLDGAPTPEVKLTPLTLSPLRKRPLPPLTRSRADELSRDRQAGSPPAVAAAPVEQPGQADAKPFSPPSHRLSITLSGDLSLNLDGAVRTPPSARLASSAGASLHSTIDVSPTHADPLGALPRPASRPTPAHGSAPLPPQREATPSLNLAASTPLPLVPPLRLRSPGRGAPGTPAPVPSASPLIAPGHHRLAHSDPLRAVRQSVEPAPGAFKAALKLGAAAGDAAKPPFERRLLFDGAAAPSYDPLRFSPHDDADDAALLAPRGPSRTGLRPLDVPVPDERAGASDGDSSSAATSAGSGAARSGSLRENADPRGVVPPLSLLPRRAVAGAGGPAAREGVEPSSKAEGRDGRRDGGRPLQSVSGALTNRAEDELDRWPRQLQPAA